MAVSSASEYIDNDLVIWVGVWHGENHCRLGCRLKGSDQSGHLGLGVARPASDRVVGSQEERVPESDAQGFFQLLSRFQDSARQLVNTQSSNNVDSFRLLT
jgi:hypothetical protein